jgi:hypothetical protein
LVDEPTFLANPSVSITSSIERFGYWWRLKALREAMKRSA